MVDLLPHGWTQAQLGDLADWFSGGTPRTSEASYWNGDIPWITSGSLTQFYLRDSARRLTVLGLKHGSRLVPVNSIIFVVRGMSLKTEFRIGITRRPVAFGQDCKALVPNPTVDPLFLAQAIRARTDVVLAMVDEAGHGTGRLATDRIKSLSIALPPIQEQRAIASVFSALDDKIEANQRTIQVEEELATRLVDQAPIQLPLNKIAAVQRTSINPALSGTTMVDHFSLPAFDHERLPLRQAGAKIKSGKLRIDNVSVLVSRLNPHIPRVWYAVSEPGVLAVASTEFVMLTPTNNVTAEEVWACCNTSGFIKTLAESVTGTTGSHQRVQASDVLSMEVGDPRSIPNVQRTVVQAMVQSAYLLRKESILLAKIRDTLLPKLLSGSLRIHKVETLLESMT